MASNNKIPIKHVCDKCTKNFKSKQGLLRHHTRKIPCDQPLDLLCERCDKKFSTQFNLDRHINKKNPCKLKKNFRTVDEEKELLEIKHKNDLEKIEKQKELIKLQKQKHLEIEHAKTSRKEKTAQVINNIQNNIHIDKLINYNVTQNTYNVICANEENLQLPLHRFKILTEKEDAINMVYPNMGNTNTNLPVDLISRLHGKEAPPRYRNLWYNSELDGFYRVMDNKWEYIKEEEELTKQIRSSLHSALEIIKEQVSHYNKYDDNYYGNYGRFQGFLKEKEDSYYRDLGTKSLS